MDQSQPTTTKTSGLAISAVILCGFSLLVPILAIPGVICGHAAQTQCKQQPAIIGHGLALVGLILGYGVLFFYGSLFTLLYWIALINS